VIDFSLVKTSLENVPPARVLKGNSPLQAGTVGFH